MNLHGVVRGMIRAVNPDVLLTLKRSTGSTTLPSGRRVPAYDTLTGYGQVQPVRSSDLLKVSSLNLQTNLQAVYLYGAWYGVVRAGLEGGDMLQTPDGRWHLVVLADENWPDWSRVVVALQTQPPAGV